MPDGEIPAPFPDAWPPICRSELMIEFAKFGPLIKSHQKKPVKIVNRANSAKNSAISALRSANIPKVQTMLISANVQNNQLAWVVTMAPH